MRFASSDLVFISNAIAWLFFIALCFSVGGSKAFAGILPGTTCPPGFTCFSIEPRDGVCQHPAVVLDEQTKSTRYEEDRFSRAYEKACVAKTSSLVTRQGTELLLKLGTGATKRYKDKQVKRHARTGLARAVKHICSTTISPSTAFSLSTLATMKVKRGTW